MGVGGAGQGRERCQGRRRVQAKSHGGELQAELIRGTLGGKLYALGCGAREMGISYCACQSLVKSHPQEEGGGWT